MLRTLDPAWLREQYEDNHRSFVELTADLDIPPSDLARHARKLGLAIRHGVSAHRHILADQGGPDAFSTTIWAVFAARGAGQRIQRLLAIHGHPDLDHAAKHLGVRKAALARQVAHLDHAVGATLLEITPDPDGIRLTPPGEKFAQDVLPILALLDRTDNGDRAVTTPESAELPRNCHGAGINPNDIS